MGDVCSLHHKVDILYLYRKQYFKAILTFPCLPIMQKHPSFQSLALVIWRSKILFRTLLYCIYLRMCAQDWVPHCPSTEVRKKLARRVSSLLPRGIQLRLSGLAVSTSTPCHLASPHLVFRIFLRSTKGWLSPCGFNAHLSYD